MPLERAEWHDVLAILRETVSIWSTGLSPHDYRRYIWLQMHHFWARDNFRFYIYREEGEIKSSCKLYKIKMSARGKEYNFCGVGAVYTLSRHRGQNCARRLLEELIDLCDEDGADGMILFSDIGAEYYEEFGFIEIGSAEFSTYLEHQPVHSDNADNLIANSGGFTSQPLRNADVDLLMRHHKKWVRKQPYGVDRSSAYWNYKIARENFLNVYSDLSWPQLEVTFFEEGYASAGYAITECGGSTMRIMEVVGNNDTCVKLWNHLLARASAKNLTRVRGWESVIRDFEPNYNFKSVLSSSISLSEMHYSERSWGRCMMLPLNPEIDEWLDVNPCPILELDHL